MTGLNLNALTLNTPSNSGSWTFSVTRDQIIRQAMLDIGALQEGEVPTAQETTDCAFKLNMLVKQWMGNTDFAPGLKIWTRRRGDLFLQNTQYCYQLGQTGPDNWVDSTTGLTYPTAYGQTALIAPAAAGATVLSVGVGNTSQFNIGDYIGVLTGQSISWSVITAIGSVAGTVTISTAGLAAAAVSGAYVWNYTNKGVRPLAIITAVLRDIYNNDTPLTFMTTERYESLPTKVASTNIADPTAILYESQFTNQNPSGKLYLDVGGAQDVTKHIHAVYLCPTMDFVNPGDAPDYPQQWYRPLVYGLAKDVCGMFDCVWTKDLEENFRDSLAIARQADPATTDVFFEVNSDSPYGP